MLGIVGAAITSSAVCGFDAFAALKTFGSAFSRSAAPFAHASEQAPLPYFTAVPFRAEDDVQAVRSCGVWSSMDS